MQNAGGRDGGGRSIQCRKLNPKPAEHDGDNSFPKRRRKILKQRGDVIAAGVLCYPSFSDSVQPSEPARRSDIFAGGQQLAGILQGVPRQPVDNAAEAVHRAAAKLPAKPSERFAHNEAANVGEGGRRATTWPPSPAESRGDLWNVQAASPSRARAPAAISSDSSMPTQPSPNSRQAASVEPEPANGSRTRPPAGTI